jgi:hypothetical protein
VGSHWLTLGSHVVLLTHCPAVHVCGVSPLQRLSPFVQTPLQAPEVHWN